MLNFINNVCNSSNELVSQITSDQRLALWDSLWDCLKRQVLQGESGMNDRMSRDRMPSDRMPRDRMPSDRIPSDRMPCDRISSDSPELSQSREIEAGGHINDKNSMISAVCACLARLLSSCKPEEFSQMMKSVEQNFVSIHSYELSTICSGY